VALICLDKNFKTADNLALYAITDLLKCCKSPTNKMLDMQEVGKEIKGYTELNGRTDSNMIDALNAMYGYDMTKEKLQEHILSKELTLNPHTAGMKKVPSSLQIIGHLTEYEAALNRRVANKIDAL
jgi:hypothetical protein